MKTMLIFLQNHVKFLIITTLFIAILVYNYSNVFRFPTSEYFTTNETNESTNRSKKTLEFVHIDGCVVKPDVYEINNETRLFELITKAGGYTPEADLKLISIKLNLSEIVEDQGKYFIPCIINNIGDTLPESNVKNNTLININSANIYELQSLEGIGPKTASKIIENRPYLKLDELVARKILTAKLYEKLHGQLTL